MTIALEAQILINYGRSFSEHIFEIVMDPADEDELGENPFSVWTAVQEEQRMSGILDATEASLTVEWTVRDSLDDLTGLRSYEDLGYLLRFEKPGSTVEYSGNVDLWFDEDETGQWFIVKWIDKRDNSGRRTWCWLRAANRIGF